MILKSSASCIFIDSRIVAIGHDAGIWKLLWQKILEPHGLAFVRPCMNGIRIQAMNSNDTIEKRLIDTALQRMSGSIILKCWAS